MTDISDNDATGTDVPGVSRRTLLRNGALAAGTAAWLVPAIEFVSATPAHAATPSAPAAGGGAAVDGASGVAAGSAGRPSTGLASTGPDLPITSTAVAASVAVAVGASAVAASHWGRKRAGGAAEADPSSGS